MNSDHYKALRKIAKDVRESALHHGLGMALLSYKKAAEFLYLEIRGDDKNTMQAGTAADYVKALRGLADRIEARSIVVEKISEAENDERLTDSQRTQLLELKARFLAETDSEKSKSLGESILRVIEGFASATCAALALSVSTLS
ncbi:MAG: hypothetical protein Q8O64_05805 [Sideroxyarcus sp.]|nr:hypothetical protein [Sideroxyarcus sp.]